jgi:hypothetical protein
MLAKVYDRRSKFVHHGRLVATDELPPQFFDVAWRAVLLPLLNSDRFESVSSFAAALDRESGSGAEGAK